MLFRSPPTNTNKCTPLLSAIEEGQVWAGKIFGTPKRVGESNLSNYHITNAKMVPQATAQATEQEEFCECLVLINDDGKSNGIANKNKNHYVYTLKSWQIIKVHNLNLSTNNIEFGILQTTQKPVKVNQTFFNAMNRKNEILDGKECMYTKTREKFTPKNITFDKEGYPEAKRCMVIVKDDGRMIDYEYKRTPFSLGRKNTRNNVGYCGRPTGDKKGFICSNHYKLFQDKTGLTGWLSRIESAKGGGGNIGFRTQSAHKSCLYGQIRFYEKKIFGTGQKSVCNDSDELIFDGDVNLIKESLLYFSPERGDSLDLDCKVDRWQGSKVSAATTRSGGGSRKRVRQNKQNKQNKQIKKKLNITTKKQIRKY